MEERSGKHKILILGASGFLGQALYKELCPYFRT
ncbi:MAG TPA: dTDP-4-dehydrorhamnose reductase, partial [Aquaticitalea sp.]|nr:dTDP-4-dehydrorhamnose reductase [Aquaticitalea sp.]